MWEREMGEVEIQRNMCNGYAKKQNPSGIAELVSTFVCPSIE